MSDKVAAPRPVPEEVLRGGFGPKPELSSAFNEAVLDAWQEKEAGTASKWRWRAWVMCAWWAFSISLVCYGLTHSAILEEGGSGLALIISLTTLLACGLVIFGLLRYCGVRLSDTLLNTLELG